jgi:hypothetical protein
VDQQKSKLPLAKPMKNLDTTAIVKFTLNPNSRVDSAIENADATITGFRPLKSDIKPQK